MRQRGGRIALVEGHVREDVARVGHAAVAATGQTAVCEGGQRPRPGLIAAVPGAPRGETDCGGVQRMLGIGDLEDAFRPAGRLETDTQVHKLRQGRHQPKRRVDVTGGHGVFERRAQVVVVGQYPLNPAPFVGRMHARRSAFCQFSEVNRMPYCETIVNPQFPQAFPAVCAQRLQDAVARPVSARCGP